MNDQEHQAFAEDCLAEVASRSHQTTELPLAQSTRLDSDGGDEFQYGDEPMAEADAAFAGKASRAQVQ